MTRALDPAVLMLSVWFTTINQCVPVFLASKEIRSLDAVLYQVGSLKVFWCLVSSNSIALIVNLLIIHCNYIFCSTRSGSPSPVPSGPLWFERNLPRTIQSRVVYLYERI